MPGTPTTDSSTANSTEPSTPQESTPQKALEEALVSKDKLRRLGWLLTQKSFKRNLKTEDDLSRQRLLANEERYRKDLDVEIKDEPESEGDDVEITAAGDVAIHNHYETPPESEKPAEPVKMSLAKKVAIGATLAAGGAGSAVGGMVLNQIMNPPAAAVDSVDTNSFNIISKDVEE